MNLLSAILFIFLGLGIFLKEKWQGKVTRLLGLGTLLFVMAQMYLYYSKTLPIKLFNFFGGVPSLYENITIMLLSSLLLVTSRGVLRRIFYVEFATGLSFLLSALYILGFIFPSTGILEYAFYNSAHPYLAILNIVFAITVFFIMRSRYETRYALIKKIFTLVFLFAGVLLALGYASYINTRFSDPDFNPWMYVHIVPLVIAIFGTLISIFTMFMIYAFSSLRERNISYANDMTKGLRQAKAKDEAMLLSIGEGLVATGKDGNIVFVNRAFEDLLGWREEEVQGKLFTNLVHMFTEEGQEIERVNRPINKILRQNAKDTLRRSITSNMYYRRKNGTTFPVAITISPIIVEGEIIGAVEVFRDISEEKAIDKEKTEFVSLASHQLRTPLSAVNWYAEMLLSGDAGKLTKLQKEYVTEIFAGNKRMIDLVNDLLNVSRLELGTFSVNPEKVDIVASAYLAIDEQKQEIKKKKIKVTTEFPDERPCEIDADPKLLHMIFQNLLSNAIKYTPDKGEIRVAVVQNADTIEICVKDTGIGIPKDQQDKIFTKLFRADNVKSQDVEGTGLGLYIIKSIIEASSGSISFYSEEGRGTEFCVTLPRSGMHKKEGTRELS